MSKGFNIAEAAHVVNVLPPVDMTGGKTGVAFSMKNAAHASILLTIGASAAAFTKIFVNQCTAQDGTGAVAIAYNIYKQETAAGDVLGPRTAVAATGYTPSANDGIFYIIELDASELLDGSPYVQVAVTNGSNSVIGAIVVILSGLRDTAGFTALV
jgi:hypothetical protein